MVSYRAIDTVSYYAQRDRVKSQAGEVFARVNYMLRPEPS